MLPDRVSKPGPLTSESGALPIALRGLALHNLKTVNIIVMLDGYLEQAMMMCRVQE